MSTIEVGELLYEVTFKITGITEYGVSFESLMAGEVAPPPEGARFDVAFEGASSGPGSHQESSGTLLTRWTSVEHESTRMSGFV